MLFIPKLRSLRAGGGLMAIAVILAVSLGGGLIDGPRRAEAHIIPSEKFHPVAASYRRMTFLLNLNPVLWDQVQDDASVIAKELTSVDRAAGETYQTAIRSSIRRMTRPATADEDAPGPGERVAEAKEIFERSTRAVSRIVALNLAGAASALDDYPTAAAKFDEARKIWRAFEHEIKATDRPAFSTIGLSWLELSGALGRPGILTVANVPSDESTFHASAAVIVGYLGENFGAGFRAPEGRRLAPLPSSSATFDASAPIPVKLPPGHNINKQVPRPRQILNLVARGAFEGETALVAIGDMAFDSAYVFGDPAQSLSITCNTCHNKGVTNPLFFIPGLSSVPGTIDVSGNFFAPHANNALFDPLDIPDLRGIRFTAPYGRNGRFASLREFVRNVIVSEFDGPEPDPLLLDGMIAYMNEFDFLPNPALNPDGTLSEESSASARRGEELFNRSFEQMGGRSCAACHVPSDNFVDRKRHDIGSVEGSSPGSRDRALDTPTLLSVKHSPPYFHDGSQPTLRSVNEWFNSHFNLGLGERELDDLTAYVETVGDGVESYEDSIYYLDAEMEEFSFFLSTYEHLKRKNKPRLMDAVFQTIASEISNHKWELQDLDHLPIMERLAELMEEAYDANLNGDVETVDAKVAEYRRYYAENVEKLK